MFSPPTKQAEPQERYIRPRDPGTADTSRALEIVLEQPCRTDADATVCRRVETLLEDAKVRAETIANDSELSPAGRQNRLRELFSECVEQLDGLGRFAWANIGSRHVSAREAVDKAIDKAASQVTRDAQVAETRAVEIRRDLASLPSDEAGATLEFQRILEDLPDGEQGDVMAAELFNAIRRAPLRPMVQHSVLDELHGQVAKRVAATEYEEFEKRRAIDERVGHLLRLVQEKVSAETGFTVSTEEPFNERMAKMFAPGPRQDTNAVEVPG